MRGLNFPEFLAAWIPAVAVTASVEPAPRLGDLFIVQLGPLPVPVVTCALGALAILCSRPFARSGEAELGWPLFLLVSLVMLIVAELWIIESRPGWLFAFVVSFGLGFSGYSLLELFGDRVKDFVGTIFTKATATIGKSSGSDQ
ncbi:MAG: hypothetical protein COW16_10490 [Sphingomonadales bacterium CG12_big_fil_rev_8_21_14_0_65_65_10]|nr:MAG: hypothetical protein COW16_10490 [Sphingomonadales bacterium CG12_big_fil_rev_8_21_14_0_65_65_10]